MPETNLIEIVATDEFHGTTAYPSEHLKSLPTAEQIAKLMTYIEELQGEYELAADRMERARVAVLKQAAKDYLKTLQV